MSTRSRIAMLACAALPLGLMTMTAPAEAGTIQNTEIVGKPAKKLGMYHDNIERDTVPVFDTVTYKADLTNVSDDSPVTGAPLVLQRKVGQGNWQDQGSVNTDSNGHAEGTVEVGKSAKYRWVYAGDPGHNPSMSDVMVLKAMRDLNADSELTSNGNKVKFHGNVNPGWGNHKISLYKRVNNGRWHKVDTKKTTRTGGWAWKVGFPPRIGPDWYFRAGIKGGGGFVKSTSAGVHTYTTPARHGGTVGRAIL